MWQKLHWRNRSTSSRAAPWIRHNLKEGFFKKSKLAQHAYEEGQRIGWDKVKILETGSNSRYSKCKESAHMACLTNPFSQPIWTSLPSGSSLSGMRLLTQRDQYDVANSSRVSVRFYSLVFSFYFTDDASFRHKIIQLILVLSFYCISSYLSSTKPRLRHLYSCGHTDMECPVILSKRHNRVSPASSEDGNRSSFRNIVFVAFLEYRTMVRVKLSLCLTN
jgi:hypothetical protein